MLKIEFSTDNAAFDDDEIVEASATIHEVAERVLGGEASGSIVDTNGNRIGSYDTDEQPKDTSYNGWTNYETWVLKLWQDNDQCENERWLDAAKNAESKRGLADQMQEEYEDAVPEVTGLWSDLLSAALGEVDWFEIAEHLLEEVKENTRYDIEKIVEAGGSTSSDSCLLEDIVEGIEDLLPEQLLDEFNLYDDSEDDADARNGIFDEICDYLNEVAPEGVTFGTQDGDGVCYGFWKGEEDEAEESA